MEKIITSHKHRVIQAKRWAQHRPERISRIDLEAVVEFYLLEDVVRLYKYRLDQEIEQDNIESEFGLTAHQSNLEKFTRIKVLFVQAVEVARALIDSGNYKEVWGSIPERKLMRAASSVKNLQRLREIAADLLRKLMDDAVTVGIIDVGSRRDLEDIKNHDENVRRMNDLPSLDEVEATIKAAEIAIPSAGAKRPKANLN